MVRSSSWLGAGALASFVLLGACNALSGAGDLDVGDCSGSGCPNVLPNGSADDAGLGSVDAATEPNSVDAGADAEPPDVPGGFLDTTFGAGGVVLSGLATDTFAVVSRADGRFYVGGTSGGEAAVVRFLANGTPDTTFGGNGRSTTNGNVRGSALALGANDKPVVAGAYTIVTDPDVGATATFPILVRFDDVGRFDSGFGQNGGVSGAENDVYNAMISAPAGALLVAGQDTSAVAPSRMTFWRFNANGQLDAAFGTNGKQGIRVGSGASPDQALAVAAGPTSYVAGGQTGISPSDMAVARVTLGGAVDAAFAGGKVTVSIGAANPNERATSVAVSQADEVVVGGEAPMGNPPVRSPVFAIARFTNAGVLDQTFGNGGKVVLTFASATVVYQNQGDYLRGVFVDAKGRVVAVGHAVERVSGAKETISRVVVTRLTKAGTLDPLFGEAGRMTFRFDPGQAESIVTAATIDPAGKLLVVGRSNNRIALARIQL